MAKDRIVFISGANRGIGFGLTKKMSDVGYHVFAGYRDEGRSGDLLEMAGQIQTVFPIKVDVTKEGDLERARDRIADEVGHLDVLVNNAGVEIKDDTGLDELEWKDLSDNYAVNVGGPFLSTRYLAPLLKKGAEKKVINITSKMGSIELSTGDSTPYRLSKAALNMLTKNQAMYYEPGGIIVVALCPGWVRTDMGGASAPLSIDESTKRIVDLIETITIGESGRYLSLKGADLPY